MNIFSRKSIIPIILVGFLAILIAIFSIGNRLSNDILRVNANTQNLYMHPFQVSNAAADLKISILQARNDLLQIVFLKKNVAFTKSTFLQIEKLDQRIVDDIFIIKQNFLGDMSKVNLLESNADRWKKTHHHIIELALHENYKDAEKMVKSEGTPIYEAVMSGADYILSFSQNKGKEFATDAEIISVKIVDSTELLLLYLVIATTFIATIVIWRVRYLQSEINRITTLDFLTNVPNRRYFMELTEREFKRAKRYKTHFILTVIDLDLFKRINDAFGHQVGDKVLKHFCAVCSRNLRDTDIFGRIGGEEFAIVLPNTRLKEAQEVIERIRSDIEKTGIEISNGNIFNFTASFGLTEADANASFETSFKLADEALYEAKKTGRNKICIS